MISPNKINFEASSNVTYINPSSTVLCNKKEVATSTTQGVNFLLAKSLQNNLSSKENRPIPL